MKRLIATVLAVVLLVSCDVTKNGDSERIIIHTQPVTTVEITTETNTEPEQKNIDYIANTNSRKFHYPDCSSVDLMSEHNKWEFSGDREYLISLGYEPCKRCEP